MHITIYILYGEGQFWPIDLRWFLMSYSLIEIEYMVYSFEYFLLNISI